MYTFLCGGTLLRLPRPGSYRDTAQNCVGRKATPVDKTKKATESSTPVQTASPLFDQQTLTLRQTFDLALQHHRAGNLSKAKNIYQQILEREPNQPNALHLLGVIAYQGGENDIALDLIRKTLTLKPDFAEAHSNLGLALQELGQLGDALAQFQKAIDINLVI